MFDDKNLSQNPSDNLSDLGQNNENNSLMNQTDLNNQSVDKNKGILDLNQGKNFPFKKVDETKYPDTPQAIRAEDIFAGSEKEIQQKNNNQFQTGQNVNSPAVSSIANSAQSSQNNMSPQTEELPVNVAMLSDQMQFQGGGGNKWLTVIIIFLVVVVLGLAGYWVYNIVMNSDVVNNFDELNGLEQENNIDNILDNLKDQNQVEKTETQTVEEVVDTSNEDEMFPAEEDVLVEQDSDQDGLSDSKEIEIGTNPARVDTDFDGLSDREEVEIYKTDPASADTDRDGYLDGVEVENGYNPLGPGKLGEAEQVVQ